MSTEERDERIRSFFDGVLKISYNKRNMKKLNEEINYYFKGLDMNELLDFDNEVDFENEREAIDVVKEKVVLMHCLFTGLDYKNLTDNDYIEILKKNPLLEHLASYKLEKYGFEIFKDMGLEIKGFTSDKKISVIEREDMSEEQRLEWEKQKEKMEKEGNLETRDIFLENNDKEIENEIQA